ncbi:META domain-containing protein [Asticcacaulis sp. ZE23SCel15]|uniref:META domain-containing protein n=1 Tax=Asticcacaulis sp. ZE23SCel15 TaxID=3059027 RepID=UPI00265EBBE5|nr:META domain-containing protein [Asticcacaulis sp. ZE23SCel15]WKL56562.1 META domain-containing protein [Asticcacaulis sp. ZE23SCel15]
MKRLVSLVAVTALLAFTGCTSMSDSASSSEGSLAGRSLAGTSWQLVSFTSSDDAIGVIKPSSADQYTVSFGTDGTAALKFDCNRGSGTWQATPSGEGGSLTFGPIGTTRMMCPPGPLDARLPRDTEYVRSYRLVDGQLNMNLMADGGTYTWARVTP